MRKIVHASMTICIAALVITGCGQKPASQGTEQGKEQVQGSATSSPEPTAKTAPPQDEKQSLIETYYGDASGNQLVKKSTNIRYTTEPSKYLSALNALKTSNDPNLVPLLQDFTFKLPDLKEDTLTIDLTFKEGGQLGANGEDLILQAIQKTIFQFSEVKAIEILKDGKKVNSLMGHKDLPHPIKRS